MATRKIKPVENSAEKAMTYRQMISRYNKAMREGFFFEAIVIDYAILEDRFRSFIYHIGGLETRNSLKIDNKTSKKFLVPLYNAYTKQDNQGLNVKNISTKYNLIRAVIDWAAGTEAVTEKYQMKLKLACERIDKQEIFDCIDEVEKWCEYRGEIIHGLMNKNLSSLYSDLETKSKEGMDLAKRIDAYVETISKGHIVRLSLNLKTE